MSGEGADEVGPIGRNRQLAADQGNDFIRADASAGREGHSFGVRRVYSGILQQIAETACHQQEMPVQR